MLSEWKPTLEQAWLVAAREYRERVRSRAFLLTTLFTPVVFALVFGGGSLVASHTNAEERIVVAGDDPALASAAARELKSLDHGPSNVEVISPVTPAALAGLNRRIEAKDLSGYLLLRQRAEAVYVSGSAVNLSGSGMMSTALTRAAARSALLARGLRVDEADRLLQRVPVATEQVRHGRAVASDSKRGFLGAYSLVGLLYFVVLIYGMNVARSVVQEKTSRIYEVLLATARADSLMLGKLLGVGAVGLTQVGAWFVLLGIFAGSSLAASYGLSGGLPALGLRPVLIAFFLIFFLLGYLFYSALSAAIGAFVGAEQELQQFSFILVAPLMVSVFLMSYVLDSPGSPMAVTLSLIPPFTPMIMYLRLCAQTPPVWQLALSIVLLIAAIALAVWFAARVYRIGILMHGKWATLPEALRWLRAS